MENEGQRLQTLIVPVLML